MAYFPNGCAGEVFDEQCSRCRYGQMDSDFDPCPIWLVQHDYNYEACNNETATKILDALVKNDGTCTMFALEPSRFSCEEPPPDTVRRMLDELGK